MTSTLADAIRDRIDEMPSGTINQEQAKDSLHARLDALLADGGDLIEFADIVLDNADDPTAMDALADALHDLKVGLDTGELTQHQPIHIGLLTADRATALTIAREASAYALYEITGQVAR